jgi:hypothetical protein
VYRNNILIYIQQGATLHSLPGNCSTCLGVVPPPIIRNADNYIYCIWYLSHRYCYVPLSWKSWNWFECAVGGNVTHFILSGNCSTCFGWYNHPSSGAQTTVSTASGYLSHRYCYLPLSCKSWNRFECAGGGARHPQHTQTRSNSSTIAADSSNGVTNTRSCRRVVCAPDEGWKYHPKYVEQFSDINKLCKFAYCWIYSGIYLRCTNP